MPNRPILNIVASRNCLATFDSQQLSTLDLCGFEGEYFYPGCLGGNLFPLSQSYMSYTKAK